MMAKDCNTCKYEKLKLSEKPCRSCSCCEDENNNWVAKKEKETNKNYVKEFMIANKLKINPLENDNIIVKGNGGGSESRAIPLEFPQDAENNEYRYICPDWLNEIAIGLTAEAEKHPGEAWRQIPADEHLARALRHINLYRMGDRSENHLINSAMRLMMAFATQEVGKDD